jgi:MFS family permease
MVVLAPLHSIGAAAVLLFVVGFGFSLWSATSQSILQLSVPDALRGRVVGLYIFALAGLTPAGSLLAGWLAAVGGTKLAFAVAGAAGLLVTAAAVPRARKLRSIPRTGRSDERPGPAKVPLALAQPVVEP